MLTRRSKIVLSQLFKRINLTGCSAPLFVEVSLTRDRIRHDQILNFIIIKYYSH
jgi:hypothetical protein